MRMHDGVTEPDLPSCLSAHLGNPSIFHLVSRAAKIGKVIPTVSEKQEKSISESVTKGFLRKTRFRNTFFTKTMFVEAQAA